VVAAGTVVECYSLEGIAEVDVPVLAVHGEGDFATATTATREVLAKLRGPVGLVVSKGADHFFRDREAEVARLTLGFFENPLEWLAHLRAAGHTLSGARRPSVPTTRRSP
jgi:alpha/beta superfamily hydrolase